MVTRCRSGRGHPPIRAAITHVALCLLLAAAPAGAQVAERPPGSELTVYLATMGQGDQVWEKFGHNAIWIRDALTGTTIAYNYGMFDFAQDRFIPRLMKGSMLYSMGVSDADRELAAYSWFNRSVTLQRLNMTPAQKHALREFLEWNWLPQNRDYLYDYFRDNCSTRVRDALDRVLNGAIRSSLSGVPTGTSYRSESLRLTAASPAVYTGLMLGLGLPTDRPIDAWEATFVPMDLMERLRTIQVTDEAGRTRPLVAEETIAFEADREPPPAAPPNRLAAYLLFGLLAAGGMLLLTRAARTGRFGRAALAMAILFWGIVTGFFGVILALLWMLTDHVAAYPNMNLLHVNPLGLLLAAAAPFAIIGSRTSRVARLARPTAVALAALSAIGLLLLILPVPGQMNGPLAALLLPIHVAVAAILYHSGRQDTSPAEDDIPVTPGAYADS